MNRKDNPHTPQTSPDGPRLLPGDIDYPLGPWFQRQVLTHPGLMVVAFSALVFVAIFGMGLLFMGKRLIPFPWWLHGFLIAFLTSVLVGTCILWTVRQMEHNRARELEQLRMAQDFSHHVGNALQVLIMRQHIAATGRDQAVDDAVERICWAMREIRPRLVSTATSAKPDETPRAMRRGARG
jgi:hypothetical protein